MRSGHPPVVLVEPDRSDELTVRRSLAAGGLVNPVVSRGDAAGLRALLDDPTAPTPAVLVMALELPAQAGGSRSAAEGLAQLRAVRRDPELAQLPVVVLGGLRVPDDAAVERVHALGAAYLAKPVAFRGLVQVIRGLALPWALTAPAPAPAPATVPVAAPAQRRSVLRGAPAVRPA